MSLFRSMWGRFGLFVCLSGDEPVTICWEASQRCSLFLSFWICFDSRIQDQLIPVWDGLVVWTSLLRSVSLFRTKDIHSTDTVMSLGN